LIDHVYIKQVTIGGIRGLQGTIPFSPGLNIVLGPNNSGKTSLLEALTLSLVPNLGDVRESISKLLTLEASRGSEKHALESLTTDTPAEPCSLIYIPGRETVNSCSRIEKTSRIESKGISLETVVELKIKSKTRNCQITLNLGKTSMQLGVAGPDCMKKTIRLGILTSGILPYNQFDTFIGYLKQREPDEIEELTITLEGRKYTVDLGTDPWNEMVALIREESTTPTNFYSIGKGLQRAFQILVLSKVSDIIAVDEVESAMHPELLRKIAVSLAEITRGKQAIAITQSMEATTMMASAIVNPEKTTGDREELREIIGEYCLEEDPDIRNRISLTVLDKHENTINSIHLKGCDALTHIAGSKDPRLSYRYLRETNINNRE